MAFLCIIIASVFSVSSYCELSFSSEYIFLTSFVVWIGWRCHKFSNPGLSLSLFLAYKFLPQLVFFSLLFHCKHQEEIRQNLQYIAGNLLSWTPRLFISSIISPAFHAAVEHNIIEGFFFFFWPHVTRSAFVQFPITQSSLYFYNGFNFHISTNRMF